MFFSFTNGFGITTINMELISSIEYTSEYYNILLKNGHSYPINEEEYYEFLSIINNPLLPTTSNFITKRAAEKLIKVNK